MKDIRRCRFCYKWYEADQDHCPNCGNKPKSELTYEELIEEFRNLDKRVSRIEKKLIPR
jgi:rRNA maturation endonuclease Nob1